MIRYQNKFRYIEAKENEEKNSYIKKINKSSENNHKNDEKLQKNSEKLTNFNKSINNNSKINVISFPVEQKLIP